MTLILASTSQIRLQILMSAGLQVETIAPEVDESPIRGAMMAQGAAPEEIAVLLAEAKAVAVSQLTPNALVLGCDQILSIGRRVISKSENREAARDVLVSLRGREHTLSSAAVLCRDGLAIWRHASPVTLTMRDFSDAYLEAYLARNWPEVSGAVGAYHLEGEGARLFSKVEGDYFSVLGLPLIELLSYLTQTGEIDG